MGLIVTVDIHCSAKIMSTKTFKNKKCRNLSLQLYLTLNTPIDIFLVRH